MLPQRLNRVVLKGLEASGTPAEKRQDIALPTFNPDGHKPGIVHLGLGAFSRAHIAHYTDSVLAERGGDWRIVGVSLRRADVADQLVPQDGLYTLVEQGGGPAGNAERFRILAAIRDVLVAPDSPAAVITAMQEAPENL